MASAGAARWLPSKCFFWGGGGGGGGGGGDLGSLITSTQQQRNETKRRSQSIRFFVGVWNLKTIPGMASSIVGNYT